MSALPLRPADTRRGYWCKWCRKERLVEPTGDLLRAIEVDSASWYRNVWSIVAEPGLLDTSVAQSVCHYRANVLKTAERLSAHDKPTYNTYRLDKAELLALAAVLREMAGRALAGLYRRLDLWEGLS